MSENDMDDVLEQGKVPLLIKTVPEIKALVSLMNCQICYQLMSSPVMSITGCSHNFCSLCVRTHLTVQQNCPSCFQEMHDNQIKPNKILQEIIIQLKLLLPKLAEIATNKNANNTQSKNASHSHNTSASSAQSFSNHCAPKTFASSSQSVSKSGAIAYETFAEFSQSFSQQVLAEPEPATLPPAPKGLVSCPVCGINIPEGMVNRHLDECLSGQQTRKEPVKTSKEPVKTRTESLKSNKEPVVNVFTQSTSGTQSIQTSNVPPVKKNSMKPVTKVVYNLLKDAQLRALLKKEGLDTKGDRKTMESRHKKFSVLWNAQCDEDNPLDRAEIIRIAKREEQNLSSIMSAVGNSSTQSPAAQSLLSYDRKSDPKIIDSKRKEILSKNENNFATLIEQVKRRKLESSKSVEDKPSISVINDGDLEVIPEEMEQSSPEKLSDNLSESSDDDFLAPTPKNKSCFMTQVTQSSKILTQKAEATRIVKTPPHKSKAVTSLFKQGELYITPKRKAPRELLEEPSMLKQQRLDSHDPSGSQLRRVNGGLSKSECPVCHFQIPTHTMSGHVDRCLVQENKDRLRRSSRRGLSKPVSGTKAHIEEDADDPDSDFELDHFTQDSDFKPTGQQDLENMSSPELNRSPLLTSTAKKLRDK